MTFENEAALIKAEVDGQNFDVVYPSLSVEAAPPVAIVDTKRHSAVRATRRIADVCASRRWKPSQK